MHLHTQARCTLACQETALGRTTGLIRSDKGHVRVYSHAKSTIVSPQYGRFRSWIGSWVHSQLLVISIDDYNDDIHGLTIRCCYGYRVLQIPAAAPQDNRSTTLNRQ